MAKVRRTPYAFFYLEDSYLLDLDALLRCEPAIDGGTPQIVAIALLTGERHPLEAKELEVLLSVPAGRWIESAPDHAGLARRGLLISDDDDPRLAELRRRDDGLSANQWNLYAALYHQMTRWSGVDLRASGEQELELGPDSATAAREFVARHGPPPGAFAEPRSGPSLPLPDGARDGGLYQALMERRTTRAFAPDAAMTAQELSTVLRYVFGCHGYARTLADAVCIRRTSPSGGGLHPIEAYPIVSNVDGVAPGIHHYDARGHALTLLSALAPEECRRTATAFMCGQSYFGAANVSFVLTARFYRSHWKYRRHQKAYTAILMDAAHLSQTLQLVSTDLGLGAYVTVALNSRDIEASLGLDGISEGVIAMVGCGRRAPGDSPLELRFSPRETAA